MLTIHKASAGSGKTYALAYTYIKLLLGEKDNNTGRYRLVRSAVGRHRAILAITFTNKATDEMKSRIITRLTELAMRQHCDYEDDLCNDLACRLNDLQDRARQALGSLLADYTQFNVTTIDSFFQGVLRTFARELSVTANYEIDLDTQHAISVGVREMLASINRTDEKSPEWKHIKMLTQWLGDYMEEQMSLGKNINLFRPSQGSDMIVSFVKENLNETYRLNIHKIKAYTSDIERIQRFNTALAQKYKKIVSTLSDKINNLFLTINQHNFDAANINSNTFKNVLRWQSGNYEVKNTARVYDDPIEKRYRKPKRKTDIYEIPADVDLALCDVLRYGVENLPLINFYRNVRDDLFNLGIFSDVEKKTSEYLRDNQSVLLDNTQALLRRIINRDETPFIYERLGMQLRHFLIDEFQDTSRLQWLNLAPLIEESVDNGHDDLIIGDEKQSIYRFRNADPELISTIVPQRFAGRSAIRGTNGNENTNYRSAWHIVGFNNSVFAGIAVAKNLIGTYSNVVQTIKKTELPGYVVMTPYDDENDTLENMLCHIKRQLASGYRQRDIAILVDRRDQGAAIVNFMLDRATTDTALNGLQIVTQEALRIESSPLVRRIISILRFIDSIQSVNNTAKGLMTTQQQLAAIISRFELLRGHGLSHGEALTEAFAETAAHLDATAMETVNSGFLTLPSMVEIIIEKFTNDSERDTGNIYLSAFQDLVAGFVARGTRGLHQFIKWWDETGSTKSVDVPEGIDAINVMTIHKSKGLEFACVHIPFFNWPRPKGAKATYKWFHLKNQSAGDVAPEFADTTIFNPDDVPPMMPLHMSSTFNYMSMQPQYDSHMLAEQTDTINKTYVAFTRAARELIIGYSMKSTLARDVIDAIRLNNGDSYVALSEKVPNFTENTVPRLDGHIDSDGRFEFGQPTTPERQKKDPETISMPPYATYPNPDIWRLNPLEDIDDIMTARHEGIVLHDIMARIRRTTDVTRAVRQSVARGYLDPRRCDETIDIITKAITSDNTIRWFEGYTRLLIERPVINAEFTEEFIKSRRKAPHSRPDRIVWLPDGSIEVIDYKFGDERPAYISQVRDYLRHIGKCFPEAPALRGYLWNPLTGEMRLITPSK